MTSVEKHSSFPHILADWPAPENVAALVTTREFGSSQRPYAHFNIADHVKDRPESVAYNRELLQQALQLDKPVQWLQQVHGIDVYDACPDNLQPQADALYTREIKQACAIMTADCLPVLLCDDSGSEVAAAHAGWRGLLGGVLEATVARFDSSSSQLIAWMGPAIGPSHFEVGAEVRDAFLASASGMMQQTVAKGFTENPQRAQHYYADLYFLARLRLQQMGITRIYGGDWCTYSDPSRFYSYRREATTGRMASIIYLNS